MAQPDSNSRPGRPDPRATRPGVAILTNVLTPYRVALHQRIVREMPEIRLHTVLTHDAADQPWSLDGGDIGIVKFAAKGEGVNEARPVKHARKHLAKARRITEWARREGIRAILVSGYNDLTRLEVIRWAHGAGVPAFLVTDSNSRGDFAIGAKRAVKDAMIRWVIRRCAGLLPCGSLGAEYFTQRGADPARIFYFPYEPDYDLIRGLPTSKIEEARAKLGLDPARRRLVTCARLIGVKRIDLAIDGFAAIAAARPGWDLVIIGDGPLKGDLQARVPEALRGRVKWAGFIGDQSLISAVYRGSDVLLHVSDYEPWGLVINEAVAAGMAVVSTDVVGATAELVKDGDNGRVVPAGDLAALTAALRDVTDPARIDGYKAASPARLEDWKRRGDPVEGLRKALRSVGVGAAGQTDAGSCPSP